MRIQVTEADIQAGQEARERPHYTPARKCPVAHALSRELGAAFLGVGALCVIVQVDDAFNTIERRVLLPSTAMRFISLFDTKSNQLAPFEFEIEPPLDMNPPVAV